MNLPVEIKVALIAALVAAAGWFATSILAARQEAQKMRLQTKLDFTERQIVELYAPLLGLTQQYKAAQDVLLEWENHRSGTAALERVDEYIDNQLLVPLGFQIAELLRSKVHLLEPNSLAPCFETLASDISKVDLLYRIYKELGEESDFIEVDYEIEHLYKMAQSDFDSLQLEYRSLVASSYKIAGRQPQLVATVPTKETPPSSRSTRLP